MQTSELMGRSLGADEIEYCWQFSEEGSAQCVLAYRPEERAGFAGPGNDEQCQLEAVFVGDTDILSIVKHEDRRRIERLALEALRTERRIAECLAFDAEEAETEVRPLVELPELQVQGMDSTFGSVQ